MPEPTLDDVALNMLQLEPDDHAALGCLHAQLAAIVSANRVAVPMQPLVARAMRALGSLAEGTAADPAVAMREVGGLLQQAVEAAPPGNGRASVDGVLMPFQVSAARET